MSREISHREARHAHVLYSQTLGRRQALFFQNINGIARRDGCFASTERDVRNMRACLNELVNGASTSKFVVRVGDRPPVLAGAHQ